MTIFCLGQKTLPSEFTSYLSQKSSDQAENLDFKLILYGLPFKIIKFKIKILSPAMLSRTLADRLLNTANR
jgi:hypothetical protein